ncbi:MAG: NUDIX hydrolase [Caldilineaceae bacterium]|nr:NUDIX hydrolase [Caldilineaceae bacterium]
MTVNGDSARYPTPDALAVWLHSQGVDTTPWGQGTAKSIHDLWHELQQGESSLRADPPLRCVQVVEVYIIAGTTLLVETAQHFADGRIRTRNRPPSEKLQPGEEPKAAALRCLQEELAVVPARVTISSQPISVRTIRDQSESYPNLTSEYTFYTVHVAVADLPTTAFTTPNLAHAAGDPIVAHRWAWVAREEGASDK